MNNGVFTCFQQHYGMSLMIIWHESIYNIRLLGKKSFFAMSGIIIGCASVVTLIIIGNNATDTALKVFRGLDLNIIGVRFSLGKEGRRPSLENFNLLRFDENNYRFSFLSPLSLSSTWVKYKKNIVNLPIVGTTPYLADILSLKVREGRFVSVFDKNDLFVVIGHDIALSLSSPDDPLKIGSKIEINGYFYTVIGVLEYKNRNPIVPVDINNIIITSNDTFKKIKNRISLDYIFFKTITPVDTSVAGDKLKYYISTVIKCCDSEMQIPQQLIDGMTLQTRTFSCLLAGLSGVSLIAGGIGIMNVMVINVAARRKEIGLRIAIGARPKDIRNLFLLEAVLISVIGSVVGAIIGFIFSYLFSYYSGWEFYPFYYALPLGGLSSISVGIVAGWLPANRASKLEPVRALRDD